MGVRLRRSISVIRTTALEILSEPLSLLLLLFALAVALFAPVFHYHQFGEPTRMARDAGLSALFTGGAALAVFGTIRAFRREIESGTREMALAHAITRTGFFLAKTLGAFLAYLAFALIVFALTVVTVLGAEVGGRIAEEMGDLPRLWWPCVAAGTAILLLPLALGAALNRFWRFRFVLTAMVTALVLAPLSAVAVSAFFDFSFLRRLAPVVALLVVHAAVLLSAAAGFSVRWPANAAAACAGGVFAAMLPFAGNYYLAESLAKGGEVGWLYVGLATLAALPALVAFLALGVRFSHTHG